MFVISILVTANTNVRGGLNYPPDRFWSFFTLPGIGLSNFYFFPFRGGVIRLFAENLGGGIRLFAEHLGGYKILRDRKQENLLPQWGLVMVQKL